MAYSGSEYDFCNNSKSFQNRKLSQASQDSEIDIDSDYIDVNCILKSQMCPKSKVLNLTLYSQNCPIKNSANRGKQPPGVFYICLMKKTM